MSIITLPFMLAYFCGLIDNLRARFLKLACLGVMTLELGNSRSLIDINFDESWLLRLVEIGGIKDYCAMWFT